MFSSIQPPQIADIAGLQSTLSTYMTQTQATSLLGNYYTQGQIDDTIDQKYNFILNGGASTQWIILGYINILSSDIMNSRKWSIKITMSMDKSVASDYTLIIQFKSSDSKHQNNALYDLYGNVSYYVLSKSTEHIKHLYNGAAS